MAVPALVQLKVTSAVCSFFAVAITVLRLYLRRERYWWDDACAFLSMIFLFLQVAAVFMHLPNPDILTRTDNIAVYYIMAASFYAVIWTARLSILYSVIRIDLNPAMRRHLHRVGVVFILVLAIMIAQLFWVCEPLASWKHAVSPQCPLDKQVAICQLVTDVISDLLLIAAPLRLIRHMSPEDGTRRRLMIIFSTSIVTTIVSLVHAALILRDSGTKVVIAALVEDTFSLIVCNLPVVVTAALRKYDKHHVTEAKGESTFSWRVATRKTMSIGETATEQSDTAMDVTTINLRDFSTNTQAERYETTTTVALPQLTRSEETQAFDVSDPPAGGERKRDAAKQQRSIVWLIPERYDRSETDEEKDGKS